MNTKKKFLPVILMATLMLTLTGCGHTAPTQMDNCLSWVASAHPEDTNPTQSCTEMLHKDPTAFKE